MILLLQLLNLSPGEFVSFFELLSLWGCWNSFLSCQFVNSSTYREKAGASQKRVTFKRKRL